MQNKVVCIDGGGYLEDGGIYTIDKITCNGNYLLVEKTPPFPFTSFDKNRFIPLEDDELIKELTDDIFFKQPTN